MSLVLDEAFQSITFSKDYMKQRMATDAAAIPILKDIMAAHMQADMEDTFHNGNEHGDSQP